MCIVLQLTYSRQISTFTGLGIPTLPCKVRLRGSWFWEETMTYGVLGSGKRQWQSITTIGKKAISKFTVIKNGSFAYVHFSFQRKLGCRCVCDGAMDTYWFTSSIYFQYQGNPYLKLWELSNDRSQKPWSSCSRTTLIPWDRAIFDIYLSKPFQRNPVAKW